jgi:hypothetical protein
MAWRHIFIFAVMAALIIAGSRTPAVAQAAPAAEPTREDLQLQISIMKDYVAKLEQQVRQQPNTNGEQPPTAVDPQVLEAYTNAQLKRYASVIKQYDTLNAQTDLITQSFIEHRIILRISLALVALVVVSGVAFSALQLWQSLGVAGATMSNDLEISASKIRLTSSVIGVIVLAISLAFFYVFFTTSLKVELAGTSSPSVQALAGK